MPTESEDMSTTALPNLNGAERKYSLDSSGSNGTSKSAMSNDYIQRARVTRPAPPKPSCNPMQFVQIKPCNLYQSAQEQLKRAEEVKKVKEIKKEEPEDWQSNLDNWKSSRRKRVEHIIDRVVEVKKLELEEHDRTRRKSKTFSEMLEDRGGSRRKLSTLAVYTEDDSNDLSDLGIGTSSVSGKSSLSEDCDNQSVISDKGSFELLDNNANEENGCTSRDYISSPGYDTAPTSSPDPCEYTYEGAIQDYKTRISRAQSNGFNNGVRTISAASKEPFSKDSTPEFSAETNITLTSRRMSGTRIEERLLNFEIKSSNGDNFNETNPKNDLPKVDINKRKELFEKDSGRTTEITNGQKPINKSIKERLSNLDRKAEGQRNNNQFSSDIFTIKDRLHNLEKHGPVEEKPSKIDVPVVPLKDRLSSLQNAVNKEEVKKPVQLVDEHQLEILRNQDLAQQKACNLEMTAEEENLNITEEIINAQDESALDTDREDSGIHTTDVSCSVSQTDEQPELVNYEHHHINIDRLCQTDRNRNLDDGKSEKLIPGPDLVPTKTISPSTLAEQTISLEVDIIADDESSVPVLQEPLIDLDSSVNEALELALQAIDSEPIEKSVQISNISKNVTTSLIIDEEIQQINSQQSIYENVNKVINNYEDLNNFGDLMSSETCAITEAINKVNIQPQLEKQQEKMPIRTEKTVLVEPKLENDEPYYQVPKSSEPYYEVPKCLKPIAPVYENIEILYTSGHENGLEGYQISNESLVIMEPPKEKPPPPPIEKPPPPPIEKPVDGEMKEIENHYKPSMAPAPKPRQHQPQSAAVENGKPIKRVNSTKRIKKELRNKRSSFLGIEGSADDDILLELTVAPPPDMAQFLQEERRLDKKLKAGLYDNSDPGDGRHTGVSVNHSRQCSDHFMNSSEEYGDRNNSLANKEREIIEILENEGKKHRKSSGNTNWTPNDVDQKMRSIEGQIREQEEVLRVERELLQLEQEELKRQRENLMIRENLARRELEHGAKMLMSANRRSLQNINASVSHYANIPNQIYQIDTDYRKSMSDLNDAKQRPAPPAKPLRTHMTPLTKSNEISLNQGSLVKIANHNSISPSQPMSELVSLRNYQHPPNSKIHHGNMTRHTLHTLSATPKPKFTDDWVHSINPADKAITNDSWPTYQQKRKSVPEGFNYNKHWLIQEAEQRRIDQQRGVRGSSTANSWATGTSAIISNDGSAKKPLPDSIIQTLTQRVQSKGIGDRKRLEVTPPESVISPSFNSPSKPLVIPSPIDTAVPNGQQEKILSVSGKKKCSHCGEELGRGAAMIIESLRLFYHIDCFKCCVCHIQLGDGLNGTDVRVRNQKLHCHNCYSSDDGIKFSCV